VRVDVERAAVAVAGAGARALDRALALDRARARAVDGDAPRERVLDARPGVRGIVCEQTVLTQTIWESNWDVP